MSKRPTKRTALLTRRATTGPDLTYLIEVIERLQRGDSLDLAQSRWTAELLGQIAGDIDPRPRFFRAVAHRPGDQELPFWVAAYIADCVLASPDHGAIAQSKQAAVRDCRVSPEVVRRAWLAHKQDARELVTGLRAKLGPAKTRSFILSKLKGCRK
jgi:hypothetical protein